MSSDYTDEVDVLRNQIVLLQADRDAWRTPAKNCIPAVGMAISGMPAIAEMYKPDSPHWHDVLEEWRDMSNT